MEKTKERLHSEETLKQLQITPTMCPTPNCPMIHIIVWDKLNKKTFTVDYNPNKETEKVEA